jgi:predicted ATPase with chaperone activity
VLGAATPCTALRLVLCGRKCHRVLKLARAIADLTRSERIQPAHIAMSIWDRPGFTFGPPRRME